jgi:hypothetical protein
MTKCGTHLEYCTDHLLVKRHLTVMGVTPKARPRFRERHGVLSYRIPRLPTTRKAKADIEGTSRVHFRRLFDLFLPECYTPAGDRP